MRIHYATVGLLLVLGAIRTNADDWVLTASNTIPFASICYDGNNFIAWGANDQGDTLFSVSSDGRNWNGVTSTVPLAAFAAWKGHYAGVRTSGADITLVLSTNLTNWGDDSTVYTLLGSGSDTEGFRSAILAVSESNVVVRLNIEPTGYYMDTAWLLASTSLPPSAWKHESTTWTHYLLYDGACFWRCAGRWWETSVYRSRTGAEWELCPPFPFSQFAVNSLSVDRGLVIVGGLIRSIPPSTQVAVSSFQGGGHMMRLPYTHDYGTVFFHSPTFCLTASDETSGSPMLLYTSDGNDWRRQILPVTLSAFAASSNNIVGVGQGLFYALDRSAQLGASTNASRVASFTTATDMQSVQLQMVAPTGTVVELQGTTELGSHAEWSPLWLPCASTGAYTTISIPLTVSTQVFVRAATLGNQ